ncbi:MAG: NAD(P)-dependent oxidoreductase [Mesorhizobium sp.]|nr:NAD(P)-dependent oxidoreductase [Mesorhizobium sp.]MCO5160195.1 NAD(P)-dependent oxidoreductase [Mesorhizobium sp.]
MNPILVTGAGGFVGRAIVEALLRRGDVVIAFEAGDCTWLEARAESEPGLAVVHGDICDAGLVDGLFDRQRPHAVIHCAAVVGVLASLKSPRELFRVNIEGSINLFEAMARAGTQRMIHISSEEIYGAFEADRIDENHPLRPLHGYGISKAAVEHLGRSYRATHGLDCINVRTSWVYGPHFPRDRVPINMIRAVARREPLYVPGGAADRIDHTYLDDVVAGVLGALDCPRHFHDAYHVSSASSPSLAEIASILAELDPTAPPITVGSGPYRHAGTVAMPRKGALDCTRAAEAFGYRPKFDIRAGLAATLLAERRAIQQPESING